MGAPGWDIEVFGEGKKGSVQVERGAKEVGGSVGGEDWTGEEGMQTAGGNEEDDQRGKHWEVGSGGKEILVSMVVGVGGHEVKREGKSGGIKESPKTNEKWGTRLTTRQTGDREKKRGRELYILPHLHS